MTDHAPDRLWSGIDITKTIAGVLAAVSAAVLGSFLGVAGTLVGAAVASIVCSVGTEVYHRWIDHSSKKIKSTFVAAPAAVGTPPVAAAEEESPSTGPEPPAPRGKLRWGRLAAVAGALFVLAMGGLTAFELITQRTVADAVAGTDSGRTTTVSNVLSGDDGSSKDDKPATTPSGSTPDGDDATRNEAPSTAEPTTTPGTENPGTTEPADPAATEPADETGEPASTGEPGTGQPGTGQPGADQPEAEQPGVQGGTTDRSE